LVTIPSTCDPPAQSDETLIGLRLDGRSEHTRRAYQADARLLLAAAGKPIAALHADAFGAPDGLETLEGLALVLKPVNAGENVHRRAGVKMHH
jgi:hypothetical protein